MRIRFGPRDLEFPGTALGRLHASQHQDVLNVLRERMRMDGYLWLRELLPRETVLSARRVILEHMAARKLLTPGTPVTEGVMPKDGRGLHMPGTGGTGPSPCHAGRIRASGPVPFL